MHSMEEERGRGLKFNVKFNAKFTSSTKFKPLN